MSCSTRASINWFGVEDICDIVVTTENSRSVIECIIEGSRWLIMDKELKVSSFYLTAVVRTMVIYNPVKALYYCTLRGVVADDIMNGNDICKLYLLGLDDRVAQIAYSSCLSNGGGTALTDSLRNRFLFEYSGDYEKVIS